MKTGHGITAKRLEALCEQGLFRPRGPRVLLEAILEQEAVETSLELPEFDHRTAVAWRVAAVGNKVEDLEVDSLVVNVSISGERIGSKASRWMVVHEADIAGDAPGLLDEKQADPLAVGFYVNDPFSTGCAECGVNRSNHGPFGRCPYPPIKRR